MPRSIPGHRTEAEPGNTVELLLDGREAYDAMFAAIAAAKHHVHLETYIIENDEIGRRVAEALIACKARDVDVRFIYDGYGSTDDQAFWDRLGEAGIELHRFNPPDPTSNFKFFRYDLRDHRKILIVDGEIGFTGGINFYDAYAVPNIRHGWRKRRAAKHNGKGSLSGKVAWRDTHVSIEGPAVSLLQQLFVAHWEHLAGQSLPRDGLFPAQPAAGAESVSFEVGIGGDDMPSEIYSMYLERIGGARRYAWITQAYFVPDDTLLAALVEAAKRGVDVRIIVPSVSDVTLILHASRHLYGTLLETGVRIFEYQDAVLHAKTAVVDGYWSTVGSSNLDYLSFMRNHEVNAVITGEDFARRMECTFEADLKRSREVFLSTWRHRPLTHKLVGHVACHFQNWF
jgi:cardiolipin synthase